MSRERLTAKIAANDYDKKKKKDNSGEVRRNLDGFEYDTSKASILKKSLHNINVSLGTMLAAMKELSLLKGSDITPDGMLGGRGFIMPFKEIKQKINASISDLSDITDTIADELTNPKWGLSPQEKKKVKEEKQNIEEKVEEVEETVPDSTPEEKSDDEKKEPETDLPKEDMDDISPEDVVNSTEVDTLRKYHDFIEGNVKDKVASVLSKNIIANLIKGE